MTNHSEQRRRTQPAPQTTPRFFGISVWASLIILCAALTIGLFVTLHNGLLGIPFLALFVIAVLVIALLTEPRGLFLTIASIPIFFGIFVIITSWFLVANATPDGAPLSKTQIITAIYPITLHFPVLAIATAAAALISFLRITLLKRSNRTSSKVAQTRRRKEVEAEKLNYSTVRKARTQTQRPRRTHATSTDNSQVTVEELLRRRKENSERKAAREAARERARRSLGDDLYKQDS